MKKHNAKRARSGSNNRTNVPAPAGTSGNLRTAQTPANAPGLGEHVHAPAQGAAAALHAQIRLSNSASGPASDRSSHDGRSPADAVSTPTNSHDAHSAPEAPSEWQQAVALHQAGRLDEAARLYERVIAREPLHSDALQLLGLIALHQSNPARAAELIGRSVEINPNSFGAQVNLGASYKALGQRESALRHYDVAVALNPAYVDGWIHAGNLLGELNRVAESLERYDHALKADPNHAGALNNRGDALRRLGEREQALECFAQVLARDPSRHDARLNRGVVLLELGRDEAAIVEFDALLAAYPKHGLAWNNRGNALVRLRRYAEAAESLDRALELSPDYAPAWMNRGNIMLALCRYDEARTSFARARALAPNLPEAQWNLSTLDLLEGDFDAGWRNYESRWQVRALEARRHTHIPTWLGGADIRGKRVLLWHEQGLGDTLQFSRFVPHVSKLGATPVVEVQRALKSLIAPNLPSTEVIATGEPTAPCDYATPLMSLPLACQIDISAMSTGAPYLRADPARIQHWAQKLGRRRKPLRIGLAVSGNPGHRNDANRSVGLAAFAGLLAYADCVIVQKGLREEDQHTLARLPEMIYVGEHLDDFADTAAVLANVDLVVSVDTSVAHLAGAMGKLIYLLCPPNPDWRWQLGRDDSPWYPSMRIVRKLASESWEDTVARLIHLEWPGQ